MNILQQCLSLPLRFWRDSSVRCIFAAPIGWLEVLDLLCRVLRSDGGAGPLANGLYSVYGIIGSGVGRQMLYNTTIYCLLYVVLYKERPMVYLSITVVFYSWTCCIENLVVGAMLMLQADTVRSALENPTKLAVLD